MTDHVKENDNLEEFFVSWDDIISLILKDKGISEGYFEPNVNFEVGSLSNVNAPNIAFVINKLGLKRVSELKDNTIDASKVNPLKKQRASKKVAE